MRPTAVIMFAGLLGAAAAGLATPVAAAPGAASRECPQPASALGVSRIVEIDASSGPLYGDITKYAKEDRFLAPKEVVLTFDDGPMPWITKSILDTLDRFCTKATFFSVGKMALAYPDSIKDVLARGHTLGGHTHTHPLNIARLKSDRATDEIERGFAAIALAAGQPIAPFFRFPGLSDSPGLLAHLQSRGIASFTVDVVSNDSYIGDAGRLARLTIERVEARQGGIVLFHDIKAATAKALPQILTELKARGYTVVHMRSKAPLVPVASYADELAPKLAKTRTGADGKAALVPFYGSIGPERSTARSGRESAERVDPRTQDPSPSVAPLPAAQAIAGHDADAGTPVTALAPAPRPRLAAVSSGADDERPARRSRDRSARRTGGGEPSASTAGGAAIGGWSTRVRASRRVSDPE